MLGVLVTIYTPLKEWVSVAHSPVALVFFV